MRIRKSQLVSLFAIILVLIIYSDALSGAQKRQDADKPLVFVNTNTLMPGIVATNGSYSKFAETLRANGYRVDHGYLTHIEDETLEGVDVFILAIPNFLLLDEDKAALRKFIRNGGGLFMIGYHGFADYSNLDSFLTNYGITFGADSMYGFVADVPQDGPFAAPFKCSSIGRPGGAFKYVNFDKELAVGEVKKTGGNYVAGYSIAPSLGKGQVVAIGSVFLFTDNYINDFDNKNFGLNIINFLAGGGSGQWDLKPVLCKYKGKELTGGDSITLIAKVKNIGKGVSESVKVRFYISDDGTLSSPPSTMATLKTVSLAALDPGKRKKIKVTGKLPAWLAPGEYFLHVVVDPDGKSADGDGGNNELLGNKPLTVQ